MKQDQKSDSPAVVLVPVDLSTCSSDLIEPAVEHVRKNGGRVVLLHAIQIPRGVEPDTRLAVGREGAETTVIDALSKEANSMLEPLLQELRRAGVEAEPMLRAGDPTHVIVDATKELDPDTVIMNTHGRKGLSRLLLGSVAEKVQRQTDVPVLTLRRQHRDSCTPSDCSWCPAHRSATTDQVAAEQEG